MKEQELAEIFLEEASDLIAELSHTLRDWETNLNDVTKILNLKRDLHTLKGSARMVGQMSIGSLAHGLETLADLLSKQKAQNQKRYFELFVEGLDQISMMIDALKTQSDLPSAEQIMEKIQAELPQEPGSVGWSLPAQKPDTPSLKATEKELKEEVLRIRSSLIESLHDLSSENSMIRVSVEQLIFTLGTNLQEMKSDVKRLEGQINTFMTEDQVSKKNLEVANKSQKNIQETLLYILNTIKSLSEAYTMLETLILNQTRISTELQHRLSDTRLISFETIIPRLSRIARQVAKELNKEVSFKVENVEGEMDRVLLEQLIPSFEHILRNAVDHGIETADIRQKLNKPSTGQIVVSFMRTGGMVSIDLADDGAGIDLEKVRIKAQKLGMLKEKKSLSEEEIVRFILEPGFSTRENITELSGRGVGMDVVNTAIRKLGGNLNIETKLGIGTRITIRFPFTSSLNRILIFSLHKHTYGILLNNITSVFGLSSKKIEAALNEKTPTLEYEGKKYHLVYFGFLIETEKKKQHIFQHKNFPVLLYTSSKNEKFAFLVDDILFSRELIVQALGSQFKLSNEYVGVTLLGDGRMVLVLDMETVCDKARAFLGQEKPQFQFSSELGSEISDLPLIMVVDDSISIRTMTETLLNKHQYRVMTAQDGVDALQKLEIEIPDLILLDVDMPRMNGLEFGATIRKEQKYKSIPIIIMTARVSDARIKFAQENKFDGFLEKPYQETNLIVMIESLLDKKHANHG